MKAARRCKTHLIAVSHYEENEETDKVVEHLMVLKIWYQNENELISETVYSALIEQTDNLIEKWQYAG